MEQVFSVSLDPECTPLKHRYDSCFNLWFEGYLQPALDARSSTALNTRLANAAQEHVPARQKLEALAPQDEAATLSDQPEPSLRRPLVTSWSSAFPSRIRSTIAVGAENPTSAPQSESPSHHVATPQTLVPIDTRGKTRAQIKAEEYERACGEHWRNYQECLKGAVARNTSLTTLLEQAREEHPLASQEGLAGTAWDRDTK